MIKIDGPNKPVIGFTDQCGHGGSAFSLSAFLSSEAALLSSQQCDRMAAVSINAVQHNDMLLFFYKRKPKPLFRKVSILT